MNLNNKLIERAKHYAIKCHRDTNHLYGKRDYTTHLEKVADLAMGYAHLLDSDRDASVCIAAAWAHDTIEDTRQTYNDVVMTCGVEVANVVYALTNEKGRFRNERANEKYYAGIRKDNKYIYVKLCDRMANVIYSLATRSNMFTKYQQEHHEFLSKLLFPRYMRLRWLPLPEWCYKVYMRLTKRDRLLPLIENLNQITLQ